METASEAVLDDVSACARCFSIPELVSHILHQADVTVLVNCQRVCRQWQSIIAQSQTLQENLFLIPRWRPDAERAMP